MPEKIFELPAIKESTQEYEQIEARIRAVFKRQLYGPILRLLEIPERLLRNANAHNDGRTGSGRIHVANSRGAPSSLAKRLASGQITYSNGAFRGSFDAGSSRELKELGAKWDTKTSSFKLRREELPSALRESISIANVRYQERLRRIDKTLAQQNLPAEIADNIETADLFARAAEKTNNLIAKSLKGHGVIPPLTAKEKKKIADEWQNNMDLWIKDFTEKEIIALRKDIAENVSTGNRHEAIVQTLQRSYGVTANKAKFLARQETALLMAKFKETRYTSANIKEYKWGCVAGSKNHPVRPSHKILEGKIFKWQDPPITTPQGEAVRRNNPGQDYNCRCFARPIVRF